MTDINYPSSGGGGGGGGGSVNLNDGVGNPITSQINGSKQALDVGIDVAGVQIDPRNIRMDVSGTPTAVPGNSLGVISSKAYATYIGSLAAPTTGVIVSAIDCANYGVLSFDIRTTVGTFTANVQGSNDNTNWVNIPFGTVATPNSIINTSTNAAGIYIASIPSRYVRVSLSANGTGVVTCTAVVFDNVRVNDSAKYVSVASVASTNTYFSGRTRAFLARLDASTTNITNAAYVQVLASTAAAANSLYINNATGQPLVLATGAAGSEVDQIYIPAGGWSNQYNLQIAASTRVSVKSLGTTASTGNFIISALA